MEAEAACFMDGFVEDIRQYPGLQQVQRSVRVKVPGKHFPALQRSEQAAQYWGTVLYSQFSAPPALFFT